MSTQTPPPGPPAPPAAVPPPAPAPRPGPDLAWVVPLRLMAVLSVLVLLAAGAFSVAAQLLSRRIETVVTFEAPRRLVVDDSVGDVRVRAQPGVTRAEVRTVRHEVFGRTRATVAVDGDTLRLTGRCSQGGTAFGPCAVDYTVVVPERVVVELRSTTGDVRLSGTTGGADIRTRTGDVRVDDVSGPLTLSTTTGDITGRGLTAPTVDAGATTGDVTLALVTPPTQVQARTTTGDVTVRLPDDATAYRVQADAGVGDDSVDVRTDPRSDRVVDVSATTGDVRVLPAR